MRLYPWLESREPQLKSENDAPLPYFRAEGPAASARFRSGDPRVGWLRSAQKICCGVPLLYIAQTLRQLCHPGGARYQITVANRRLHSQCPKWEGRRGSLVIWRFQCAGINRHEAENAKFLRERTSDPLGPESCAATARDAVKRRQGYRRGGLLSCENIQPGRRRC